MAGLPALQALDDWPVPTVAAAVVGPFGVLASHGDTRRQFALASVTKPLVARAAQIAIEEGAMDLDTAAGPPGSTVRHLLAHASGLAMLTGQTLPRPGGPRRPRRNRRPASAGPWLGPGDRHRGDLVQARQPPDVFQLRLRGAGRDRA